MELLSDEMLDILADVQHEIWSSWMRHLFTISDFNEAHGTVTIPANSVSSWMMQMNTDYHDLPNWERDGDRNRADKVLEAIEREI